MSFIDVHDPTKTTGRKRLLFRYDPERNIIEAQGAGRPVLVDLNKYATSPEQTIDRLRNFKAIDPAAIEEFTMRLAELVEILHARATE